VQNIYLVRKNNFSLKHCVYILCLWFQVDQQGKIVFCLYMSVKNPTQFFLQILYMVYLVCTLANFTGSKHTIATELFYTSFHSGRRGFGSVSNSSG